MATPFVTPDHLAQLTWLIGEAGRLPSGSVPVHGGLVAGGSGSWSHKNRSV